jgi:inner membrane protease subunit 1
MLLVKIGIIGHVFHAYVGGAGATDGISMVPTIPSSWRSYPYILYSTLHRRGRGIKVGDVITFKHPVFPHQNGCKRVIGMPGDFVAVVTPPRRDDDVKAVDIDDKWASLREQVIQVPEGHCWVAGDNLEWSRDSRVFGPLPLGLVKAKVVAVVLPWRNAKWLGASVDVKDHEEKEHDWVLTR